MKRAIIRITYSKAAQCWQITHGDLALACATRADALWQARGLALWQADSGGTAEIVVHRMDGRISRKGGTYPRSSDPRRSKG
jgi:hypothetical protein